MWKQKRWLTQEQLKSVLTYNPETGVFAWTANYLHLGKRHKHLLSAGSVSNGYRKINVYGRGYHAHRLAWLYVYGEIPDMIDHINGNPDDNRISNLRVATPSQNAANSRKPCSNTSGFKGVSRAGNSKFAALVTVQGKTRSLGRHGSLEEAAEAYLQGAQDAFGEFASSGNEQAPIVYRKRQHVTKRRRRKDKRAAAIERVMGKKDFKNAIARGLISESDLQQSVFPGKNGLTGNGKSE